MLVFPQMSFIWSRIQSRSGWQRSPLFSPACGGWSSSLSLGLSRDLDMFLTLTLLKNSGQLFCRRSSLWVGALLVAHGYDGFSLFGLGSDALYLLLHHIRWYRCQSVLLLVFYYYFNFIHLVKVVSSRFLHSKVTVFPLGINHCLTGWSFETMQVSCLSYCFTYYFSMHWWFLPLKVITFVFT